MNSTQLALLAGAFGVPLALLWAAHRLRRRAPRWRAAFWGALIGHVLATIVAMFAGMMPPANWSPDDTVRGFLALWLLVLAPVLGALAGAAARARAPAS